MCKKANTVSLVGKRKNLDAQIRSVSAPPQPGADSIDPLPAFTAYIVRWSSIGFLVFAITGNSFAATNCSDPGNWQNAYGGVIVVNSNLSGTMQLPYCAAVHNLQITLNGNSGFDVDAQYTGLTDCQGFTEQLLFGSTCDTASGTWLNYDNIGSGQDTWTWEGLVLSRTGLTSATATGRPSGGSFTYGTTTESGQNIATVSFANGVSATDNPSDIIFTAPAGGGAPRAGGRIRLNATYNVNGHNITNNQNRIITFGMSCYVVALESDYGTPPNNCSSTRIAGRTYSGALTDPNGLIGTYCASFIANVRLQGSAQLHTGQYVNYNVGTGNIVIVQSVTGADGTPVVAGQTVARDRAIIPGRGVLVDVDGVGTGLLANDTGGAIVGYRLDLFNGAGQAACAGYSNPIGVGACQTPQGTTCPGSALQ